MNIKKNRNMSRKPMSRKIKANTDIAPEAVDLLFEAEDVAQLVAEITGEDVEVTADENVVTFAVDDMEYTCEADGDLETVEESKRFNRKGAKRIAASMKNRNNRKPIGKTVKRFAKK